MRNGNFIKGKVVIIIVLWNVDFFYVDEESFLYVI